MKRKLTCSLLICTMLFSLCAISVSGDTISTTENTNNKISVKLGDTEGIKYKISYLKSVLDTLKEESGGVIDLRDTKNVIYDASWLNFWVICINICQIHEQNVKKLKKY